MLCVPLTLSLFSSVVSLALFVALLLLSSESMLTNKRGKACRKNVDTIMAQERQDLKVT